MEKLGAPFLKKDILSALTWEATAVAHFFAEIDNGRFFMAPTGVWSPAENLVHLIQSSRPVVLALNLPKLLLRLRFGTTQRPSKTVAQVRETYLTYAQSDNFQASGTYLPKVPNSTPEQKRNILGKWGKVCAALLTAIRQWDENALDQYLLPHPLMGKMSVREILFFTLYHNMHHVNDVQRLLEMPQSEWFE